MKRDAPLSHYEVELRWEERAGTAWRTIKRAGPDGAMSTLTFATLATAQAYAERTTRQQARIVAVGRDGGRRVVDDSGT